VGKVWGALKFKTRPEQASVSVRCVQPAQGHNTSNTRFFHRFRKQVSYSLKLGGFAGDCRMSEERKLRIGVVGAGAIGCLFAVEFSAGGHHVSLVARGSNLEAIKRQGGIKVTRKESPGEEVLHSNIGIVDAIEKLPTDEPLDYVVLAVKAHHLADIAEQVEAICGENTCVITTQNGIPWWFFHKFGGEYEGRKVASSAEDASAIRAERIIGCVCYSAVSIPTPGTLDVYIKIRFPIGEPSGEDTERLQTLNVAMHQCGMNAIIGDIRKACLVKLIAVNVTSNPISALTGATVGEILNCPPSDALAKTMERECLTIVEKLGFDEGLRETIEQVQVKRATHFKTSMLQDREAGKFLETSLLTAITNLGKIVGVPTPALDAITALIELVNHVGENAKSNQVE